MKSKGNNRSGKYEPKKKNVAKLIYFLRKIKEEKK